MSGGDSDHWLWRLSASGWLAAANTELEQGRARIDARRSAITHARRAAGMALNSTLVAMAARGWARERSENVWGRSYIEHLRALAAADAVAREPFDVEQCERCRELLAIPVVPPTDLVKLALRRDEDATRALALAAKIVRGCAGIVAS